MKKNGMPSPCRNCGRDIVKKPIWLTQPVRINDMAPSHSTPNVIRRRTSYRPIIPAAMGDISTASTPTKAVA